MIKDDTIVCVRGLYLDLLSRRYPHNGKHWKKWEQHIKEWETETKITMAGKNLYNLHHKDGTI